jgi:hypothetical protein
MKAVTLGNPVVRLANWGGRDWLDYSLSIDGRTDPIRGVYVSLDNGN